MKKNNKCITLDTDEAIDRNENRTPYRVIDLENEDEDEIVCIGVVDSSLNDELDTCSTSLGTPSKRINLENVQVIDLEHENDKPDEHEPYVIDVEAEIDEEFEDTNYTLQIAESPSEPNVIDVEDENVNEQVHDVAEPMDCRGNEQSGDNSSHVHSVEAVVHADPDKADCSIDDYHARMREHFRLELFAFDNDPLTDQFNTSTDSNRSANADDQSIRSVINEVADQNVRSEDLNQSTRKFNSTPPLQSCDSDLMECCSDEEDVIEVEDDESGDDCVITSPPLYDAESSVNKSNDSFTTLATINVEEEEEDKTPKQKKITETPNEIFRRMMPSAIPGVISLFAPERHCLPDNIRPFKFCYYYYISSHLIVKEIQKNEFYKMKDQMLVAKKVIHPCTCLSHPLNKNASRITLLTNPQSLYHRSHCYFAQNNKKVKTDTPKRRKGPRRLTYQVSFHRIPHKVEGKDFKDWNDVIIKRRQNRLNKSSWSGSAAEKEGKIDHRPFECKDDANSWDDGIKIEPVNIEPIAIKTES